MVTVPEGWRARQVSGTGTIGQLTARIIAVCPGCWTGKTLAEVLGD